MALIPTTPVCITVAGKIDDPEFHICRVLAEVCFFDCFFSQGKKIFFLSVTFLETQRLCEEYSPITIQIEAMVETDWELFIKDKQKVLIPIKNKTK